MVVVFDNSIFKIQDHIQRIEFDFVNYKGLDCLYFEIWKRVTKRKVSSSVCTAT